MKQGPLRVLAHACVFLGLSLALPGCGGGGSYMGCGSNCHPQSKPEFLYAGSLNQIQIFSVNTTTGTLGTPTAITGPNDLNGIAATPAATFLYVSDFQADAIDTFSINASTGALTPVGSQTPIGPGPNGGGGWPRSRRQVPLRHRSECQRRRGVYHQQLDRGIDGRGISRFYRRAPVQPVVDPSGKFLYVTDHSDPNGGISAYTINSASGALTPVLGSPFPTQIATNPGPTVPVVSPDGKFLFVTLLGTVNYSQFVASLAIDPNTGALSRVAGSPFPSGIGPLGAAS